MAPQDLKKQRVEAVCHLCDGTEDLHYKHRVDQDMLMCTECYDDEKDDPSYYCKYDEDPDEVEREEKRLEFYNRFPHLTKTKEEYKTEAEAELNDDGKPITEEALAECMERIEADDITYEVYEAGITRAGGSRSMKGFSVDRLGRAIEHHFDELEDLFDDENKKSKLFDVKEIKSNIEAVKDNAKRACLHVLCDELPRAWAKMTEKERKFPFGSNPFHVVLNFALCEDQRDTGVKICKAMREYYSVLEKHYDE
jgi:hypothetical protein